MYKIVVAEDDRIIRRAIVQSSWQDIQVEVAGEAADGQQALEVIRETHPQLVITDISMPFMNGIELAKAVRQEFPPTRIIFLTGYDDFQYIHAAMLLKSDDYLLKPVQMKELHEKVQQALEVWQEEQQKRQRLEESLPLLQAQFLSRLLFGAEVSQQVDIQEELFRLQIFLTGPAFAVMDILVSGCHQPVRSLFDKWQKTGEIELLSFKENEVFLLLSLSDEHSLQAGQLAQQIKEDLEKQELSAAVATSSVYRDMQDLETAVVEAKMNMERIRLKESREPLFTEKPAEWEEEKLSSLYHLISSVSLSLEETKSMALPFMVFLSNEINHLASEEKDRIHTGAWSQKMLKTNSRETLLQMMENLLERRERLQKNQAHPPLSKSVVEEAIAYMKEHYADPDLTLVKLANEVYVTAPYLSNLFKIEKNMNFTEYLLSLRMEKSKDLLIRTRKKTYEIAEAVGFVNPHYFSSCFKKYTGKTALEFRKKALAAMEED